MKYSKIHIHKHVFERKQKETQNQCLPSSCMQNPNPITAPLLLQSLYFSIRILTHNWYHQTHSNYFINLIYMFFSFIQQPRPQPGKNPFIYLFIYLFLWGEGGGVHYVLDIGIKEQQFLYNSHYNVCIQLQKGMGQGQYLWIRNICLHWSLRSQKCNKHHNMGCDHLILLLNVFL